MMTYSVESLARMTNAPGSLAVSGRLLIDSESLRLVDLEKPEFKIDIFDSRFASEHARSNWPFSQSAQYLLGVELQWVLSTVQIRRIMHLNILCPWDGSFNYAEIFTTSEWETFCF